MFSHSGGCHFNIFIVSFEVQTFLIVLKSSSCFYLVAYAFNIISKKLLLIQGHEDFPSVFSSKSSMVLAFLFGFWNHLEDPSGGEGVHLHSLAEGYGVVLAPFVEKNSSFPQ